MDIIRGDGRSSNNEDNDRTVYIEHSGFSHQQTMREHDTASTRGKGASSISKHHNAFHMGMELTSERRVVAVPTRT